MNTKNKTAKTKMTMGASISASSLLDWVDERSDEYERNVYELNSYMKSLKAEFYGQYDFNCHDHDWAVKEIANVFDDFRSLCDDYYRLEFEVADISFNFETSRDSEDRIDMAIHAMQVCSKMHGIIDELTNLKTTADVYCQALL
jgi:hypothetical protein